MIQACQRRGWVQNTLKPSSGRRGIGPGLPSRDRILAGQEDQVLLREACPDCHPDQSVINEMMAAAVVHGPGVPGQGIQGRVVGPGQYQGSLDRVRIARIATFARSTRIARMSLLSLLLTFARFQASQGAPELSFTPVSGFPGCPRAVFYAAFRPDSRLPRRFPG